MATLLTGMVSIAETRTESCQKSTGLVQLEKRLQEIDSKLEQLASYSLRSGVGAVGYLSYSLILIACCFDKP